MSYVASSTLWPLLGLYIYGLYIICGELHPLAPVRALYIRFICHMWRASPFGPVLGCIYTVYISYVASFTLWPLLGLYIYGLYVICGELHPLAPVRALYIRFICHMWRAPPFGPC